MRSASFTLALWLVAAVCHATPPDPGACGRAYPRLKPVIDAVDALTVSSKTLPFEPLLLQGKELLALAQANAETIQEVGCALPDDQASKLDECLKWVQWSCEAVPFGLFLDFLEPSKRALEQDLAYRHFRIEAITVTATRPLEAGFFTKRDYFSCAPNGISIAMPIPVEKARTLALAKLASIEGPYGDLAFGYLTQSVIELEKATCSCDVPTRTDLKNIRASLSLVRRTKLPGKRGPKVKAIFDDIGRMIPRLPQRRCE